MTQSRMVQSRMVKADVTTPRPPADPTKIAQLVWLIYAVPVAKSLPQCQIPHLCCGVAMFSHPPRPMLPRSVLGGTGDIQCQSQQ
jgi:hypothetical protein